MEEETYGSYIDVLPNDLKKHPICPHGPTLLFSRNTKKGDRKFYACAACRDRKLCRFFHWADQNFSANRREMWELERLKFIGERSHSDLYSILCNVKPLLSKHEVVYCHTCNELISKENANKHPKHDMTFNVSHHQITHPTELLKPLQCDKREAQYLFSDVTIKVLIEIAKINKIKSVICMGAPRIHEYIKNKKMNMDSILLDLDRRYHLFYNPEEFCWFNSFNYHFFFGDKSKKSLIKFLQRDNGQNFMILLDPPFGGRLEPLAHTLQNLQLLHKQVNPHSETDLSVVLIYPYFLEKHVKTCLPTFNMIDYKVTYDNHPLFSQGNNSKNNKSPIRIFTNISPEKVVLSEKEGYKFCKDCVRWVSVENRHCKFCGECTSKNGSTYIHCRKCRKCVKSTWKHCLNCKKCCLQDHKCITFVASVKCYQCGEGGHKKQECEKLEHSCVPVVNLSNRDGKRKREYYAAKCKKKRFTLVRNK